MSAGSVPTALEREQVVRSIASSLQDDDGALLLVLHEVQKTFGYVDPTFVAPIADVLNLSRADVHGVLTFYADFRTAPLGATHVRICRAEACQAVGAHALAEHAQEKLGLRFHQTSDDGAVTLDQVFCFGNCALGPTVEVNGMLYGRVDNDRLDALVDGVNS